MKGKSRELFQGAWSHSAHQWFEESHRNDNIYKTGVSTEHSPARIVCARNSPLELYVPEIHITQKCPCNIRTAIFHGCKNDNFQMTIFDIFLFAQNIDCGYTLEPPQ